MQMNHFYVCAFNNKLARQRSSAIGLKVSLQKQQQQTTTKNPVILRLTIWDLGLLKNMEISDALKSVEV